MEAGRHDADDGEGALVEIDGGTDQVGVGGEAGGEEVRSEDDDGGGAGFVVGGEEGAAEGGGDAEDGEEVRGDVADADGDGFAAAGEGEFVADGGGDVGEDAVLFLPLLELGVGGAVGGDAGAAVGIEDADELAGVGEREGFQEDGVDGAEDGGVGAEAEGEGKDGDGGEAGAAAELAGGVADVGGDIGEPARAVRVAADFLVAFVAAEFETGGAGGFGGGEAGAFEVGGAAGKVRLQFLFEVALEAVAAENEIEEGAEGGWCAHICSGPASRTVPIAATRRFQPSSSSRRRLRPAGVRE